MAKLKRSILPLAICCLALCPISLGQPIAPELAPNRGWLNTDRALRLSDELKGHVVVLDFWTYCCINCMHILPDLAHLEATYADEPVVVIGVHSAKFANEGERESIRNAMFRYDIRHPVVVDDGMAIWRKYGARGWPTFVVIGADGRAVPLQTRRGLAYSVSGEGHRALLDEAVARALAEAREAGTIAEAKVEIKLDASVPSAGGLAFPGKVLADATSARLFIADSSNDRIVVASYPDEDGRSTVHTVYGGEAGLADGAAAEARFNDPQGMALDRRRNALYIADTRNHAIRLVDLGAERVTTILGTGQQSWDRRGGKRGREQGLGSPWDVELSRGGDTLYVAMAGTHQIWSVDLETGEARAMAGTGGEDVVDGPAVEALLAQPSGLALAPGGDVLYFADSETSAIRAVYLQRQAVVTIVGAGLFEFGDVDGGHAAARLQHPLGVTVLPVRSEHRTVGARLLVADTYNHKIKLVDPVARTSTTWLGVARSAEAAEGALRLDEPGGLHLALDAQGDPAHLFIADTNNHRIVMVDAATKAWREVALEGLDAGGGAAPEPAAVERTIEAALGKTLTLALSGPLPAGHHLTPQAPLSVRVVEAGGKMLVQRTLRAGSFPVEVDAPAGAVREGAKWRIEMFYASCEDALGVCVPGEAAWNVTIRAGDATCAALGYE